MEKRWNLPERRMMVKKGGAWWLGGGGERGEAKEEGVLARRFFFSSHFLLACRPGLLAPEPRQWGPLHGGPPAPPACQGHAPEPQSRLTHPCERSTFRFFIGYCPALTECVGSQRHRRPPCLLGRELTGFAALRQWISLPSTARRMGGSLCLAYFFSYSSE